MKSKDLTGIIGVAASRKLINRCGGQRLYVPKIDNRKRDSIIFSHAVHKNYSTRYLSRLFRLSGRRIYEIVSLALQSYLRRSDQPDASNSALSNFEQAGGNPNCQPK